MNKHELIMFPGRECSRRREAA